MYGILVIIDFSELTNYFFVRKVPLEESPNTFPPVDKSSVKLIRKTTFCYSLKRAFRVLFLANDGPREVKKPVIIYFKFRTILYFSVSVEATISFSRDLARSSNLNKD